MRGAPLCTSLTRLPHGAPTHVMRRATQGCALYLTHRCFLSPTHVRTTEATPVSCDASRSESQPSSSPPHAPLSVPREDPWNDLRGLVITAKLSHPQDVFENRPIAIGRLVERLSGCLYRVKLEPPQQTWHSWLLPSPDKADAEASAAGPAHGQPPRKGTRETFDSAVSLTLDIGTRVALVYDDDLTLSTSATGLAAAVTAAEARYDLLAAMSMNMEGLVVRVNGNNTYTVLMDNGEVELSVEPRRLLLLPPGKTTFLVHSQLFLAVQAWLRSCVTDHRDCEAAALILFKRGWRLERLFLLERGDLVSLTFIPHLQREAIIEKAQWERDYYHVVRNLTSERIKDRDYRYAISKYKGTISCVIGILVVSYVFFSNLRAYDRQQRSFQLRVAAKAIAEGGLSTSQQRGLGSAGEEGHDSAAQVVARPEEEERMARVFRQLDAAHPRIVVVTGFAGNGKSALCRRVMEQEGLPAVFVHVRGGHEDTLRSVVRSLGVLNVEVCGDLMGFLSEAIREARKIHTTTNVLSRKRRIWGRTTAAPTQDTPAMSTPSPTPPDESASAPVSSSLPTPTAISAPPSLVPSWANEAGHVPLMVSAPAALGSSETTHSQSLPIIYVKLMDGSRLEKAYKEAVGLVVDHQVCHLVFEVPMESLTPQARRLSRLDFYTVPNFTRSQAFKYLLNVMEPTDMTYFVEVVGTNCNDLDELYAAVRQRGVDAVAYTAQKLMKGMRRLHAAASIFAHGDNKRTPHDVLLALQQLASVPFDQGQLTKQVPEIMAMGSHPLFKDILLYDPLRDRWFFSQQVLHTAARCFYCAPVSDTV